MSDLQQQRRKTFKVQSQDFTVQDNFEITKDIGQGAYGIVV